MRNRIKELRLQKGWSQDDLAERYGTKQQHIGRMESGEQRLNTDHMEALAKIFGITPFELFHEPGVPEEDWRAPLLDEVQAGAFADASGDFEPRDLREADRWVRVSVRKPKRFALQVRGDSMDRVLPEGGVVIVDYSARNLETGELGVFRLEGKATFKRMQRRDGEEWLEPDSNNPRHVPIFSMEGRVIEVIGRVVETQREPEIIEASETIPARRRAPRRARRAAE